MSDRPMDSQGFDDAADIEVADQLDASDTLDQGPVSDPLDTGIVANDRPFGEGAFTIDQWNEVEPETIDDRIRQEVPDPHSAYGAPDNESGLDDERVGGRDVDEDDLLRDHEVGSVRAGRLVAPDQGAHPDVDGELVGADVGVDGGAASAEEAAMHIIEDDEDDDL
ncbi:MAG: hypothetical protein KBB39_06225 [Phycicoccus sp.]|nr:hypothetical protein [Phycicoccus sp.]